MGEKAKSLSISELKILFNVIVVIIVLYLVYHFKFGHKPRVYDINYETSTLNSSSENVTSKLSKNVENVSFLPSESVASKPTKKVIPIPSRYQPYKSILYNRNGQNDNRSVFVVPRRVYYDTRIHQGKPRNVVLILAEVHDIAVKTVEACELNGYFSPSISIIQEDIGWVRSHKHGYTHCAIVVECKGLPQQSIINGSFPRLVYKRLQDNYYSFVESEMPLILKTFKSVPARGKHSAVVCTTMYGHPARFNHWLKYQKLLGVDHVHLNTDQTFVDNASTIYPYLNESLSNGFVEVEVWRETLDNRVYCYGQVTKYQDCIFRHINVFDYVLIYDYDDYFNPILSHEKDIHYYLKTFFSKSNIGSVIIPWRQMECGATEEKCKTLQDGNLTSVLSGPGSTVRTQGKCAHKVDAIMFIRVHSVQVLLPGYKSIRGIDNLEAYDKLAYIAHNRHNNRLCTT